MSDMSDLPIVDLPGSEEWRYGYEWGEALDKRFPGQDAHDFASATTYNDLGPVDTAGAIIGLVMEQEGANDYADWIWRVEFADGSVWRVEGGCDYTGWDCQSSCTWMKIS